MVHGLRGYLLPPHDPQVPPSGYAMLARLADAMGERIAAGDVAVLVVPRRTRAGQRSFDVRIASVCLVSKPPASAPSSPGLCLVSTASSAWTDLGLVEAVRAFGRSYDPREAAAFLAVVGRSAA